MSHISWTNHCLFTNWKQSLAQRVCLLLQEKKNPTGSHPDCLSSSINLRLLTKQHDVTINSMQSLNWVQRGALSSQ